MGKQIKLIPSIASADQLCLGEEIQRLKNWPYLHIDIEDGNFVPNITFGAKTVRRIAKAAFQELDAHILAKNPEQYLDMLAECGVKKTAVHIEAMMYPLLVLNRIMDLGMVPGLAMNFMTPIECVLPFVDSFNYIIMMTAEPDARDDQFYPRILDKMKRLRAALPEKIEIWADGGINEYNLADVISAGAETMIVGRCVFGGGNPYERLLELSETFGNGLLCG